MKRTILDKIKEYDRIIIFRHIRIDGDCTGASLGLREIIRTTFPEKEVFVIDDERSDYLAFLGEVDAPIADDDYADALGIVVDTASQNRIANPKYALCRELIKIDHHIPVDDYGNYIWVEQERPSCSEMIVDFYQSFKGELKMSTEAATYLYLGMVTDTGRFKYRGVNGDTMRCAAELLDIGIDTEMLYAHLYIESFEKLKFKAAVLDKMQITENGVAYIFVDRKMQTEHNLSFEAASAAVGMLDSIWGCLCWMAFIEDAQKDSIRVRLRSRFVSVNQLAEQYRGGGHACASGATVNDMNEANELIAKADAMLSEYKKTHEGWL